MGIFDSIRSAFGGVTAKSDKELDEEYEAMRQRRDSHSGSEWQRIQNEMDRYNAEMVRRANLAYDRENPNPQRVHREHGRYLPNDD